MTGPSNAKLHQLLARLRTLVMNVVRRHRRPTFGDTSLIIHDVEPVQQLPKSQLVMALEEPHLVSPHVTTSEDAPSTDPLPAVPVAPSIPTVPSESVPTPRGASLNRVVSTFSGLRLSIPLVLDWWVIGFWLSILLVLLLRFYRIDSIQSEMYGDIEIVQTYVKNVIEGKWPWYFNLSSGPLYHYLIAPVLLWLGTGYDQIKVASILVSLLILGMTYVVARRLGGRELAMIALMVAGTGSWLLLFSRLGNSQIFVPLVTVGSLLAMLYYLQTERIGWLYASAVIAAMGLYSYPQSFVVAPVMWLTMVVLWRTGVVKHRSDLFIFATAALVSALPFAWMYIDNPELAAGSYVTEKIEDVDNIAGRLFEVIWRGALAYFVTGDIVFRNNPTGVPHIDMVSSVFFVIGAIVWVRDPKLRPWSPLLIVPFLLLHVPSLLVLRYPDQVPSASRSIGAAPYVYIFIAYGLYTSYQWLSQRTRGIAGVLLAVILAVSVQQNIDRYFVRYVDGLPYRDVPIGREIVRFAEMLSPQTTVYVVGCCWRDGTPEPFFSQIQMHQPERLKRFDPIETLTCEALQNVPRPAVLIWSLDSALPNTQVESCAEEFRPVLHANRDGVPLFYSSALTGYETPSDMVFTPEVEVVEPTTNEEPAVVVEAQPTATPVLDPVGESVMIAGVNTDVLISPIDSGSIADMFDNSFDTLLRGANQNPMVVSMTMAEPLSLSQMVMQLAGMRSFRVDVELTTQDGPVTLTEEFINSEADPIVRFDLPTSQAISAMKIIITELDVPSDVSVFIHIREISLLN